MPEPRRCETLQKDLFIGANGAPNVLQFEGGEGRICFLHFSSSDKDFWGAILANCHGFCRPDLEDSRPFHKQREMDDARSFLSPTAKLLWRPGAKTQIRWQGLHSSAVQACGLGEATGLHREVAEPGE